jgi:hypothetical protein
MKYRHIFQVKAPLAEVSAFYTAASSLKAITPPLIPMQLHHVPEQMGDGDEMDFTMWLGLPLLFAYRGWKTRQLLEGATT